MTFTCKKNGRLDAIMSEELSLPRNQIEQLIKQVGVKVNDKEVKKCSYKVKVDEIIEYDFVEAVKEKENYEVDFDIDVLYEDDDIMVINKPPYLTVHPAPSVKEATVVDWLIKRGVSLSTISGEERHGIVHRIDKETSGALVIAKNNEAHEYLSKQLVDKSMGRYYVAISDLPLKEDIIVDKPIGRNRNNRLKMAVVAGGRESKSAFCKLALSKNEKMELISAKLFTGRTHQIRVHLSALSRHVIGDNLYGFKSQKDTIARVMLHAYILYLQHPKTGEYMQVIAPPFEDFENILNKYFSKDEIDEKMDSSYIIKRFNTFVSGCQNDPKPPQKPIVDQTLPKLTDIKFLSEVTEVGFEWTPSSDERVLGYYVYRSNPEVTNGKLQRVATITDKYTSHFVDTKLKPATAYQYRFSTYSSKKRESIPSDTIIATTQPLIESVSFIKAITGLPNRVKLIWRPHTSQRIASYIVERNEFSSTKWDEIAKVDGRLNAEYIDAGLKDNKVYRYRVRVKTYDGLLSKPSEIVEAGTKPLPLEIRNLTATTDVPKKIVLRWDSAVEKDFSYYKVYRALNPLLFYSYLAKTRDTNYEDLINANGKSYYYFVTTVDTDGLESPRQQNAVAGTSLSVPSAVSITSSDHDGRSINITWETKDNRATRFNVIKEYKDKKKIFTAITGNSFNDSDVARGIEYTYKVIAIDKYGLASKESESVVIEMPKE